MLRKALITLALVLLPVTGAFLSAPAEAQTAAQSVTGFLLAQGSTYGSYTCPAAATQPCFVQYGSSVPTSPSTSDQPVSIDQTTPGTTNGVVTNSGSVTAATTTPSATIGVSTQSCTVACASTIVSGAHSVYGISGSATVTGTILVYDATSCPANGTVTPKKAFAYTVANAPIGISWGSLPMVDATGIAVCFSSTGPFTATASTTAFLSVDYK